MKDIVVSSQRIARESLVFAGCIAAALAVNVFAILRYKTEWKELITTFHITLALAAVFFAALAMARLLVYACRRLLGRKAA